MAVSLAAAPETPHISFAAPDSAYRPGTCNIGSAEIDRRRRFGHVAAFATVVLFVALVVLGVPHIVRLAVALPAAVAAACYLEAALKFCIGFGWLGIFNFGAHGTTRQVGDERSRAIDRRRSLSLSVVTALIGLAVGIVAVVLTV
jgi:hypothetical protein